jgi:hypothetical protein
MWDRLAAAGFVASALESVGRLVEGYLDQSWLDGFNRAAYLPVVLVSFGTLSGVAMEAGKGDCFRRGIHSDCDAGRARIV